MPGKWDITVTEEGIEKWKVVEMMDGEVTWEEDKEKSEHVFSLELWNYFINERRETTRAIISIQKTFNHEKVLERVISLIQEFINPETTHGNQLKLAQDILTEVILGLLLNLPAVNVEYKETGGDYSTWVLKVQVD
ncbi:MAG: hypothetical protein QXT37_09290 [Thermofilaceae archaeon]